MAVHQQQCGMIGMAAMKSGAPRAASPWRTMMTISDTISRLAELYPKTFFTGDGERKPLRRGTFKNLVAADIGLTRAKLGSALRHYCSSPGYLSALVEGAPRVDLAGEPAGAVTADEAAHALEQLAKRESEMARAKPPASPQRLGLDALRRAGRARREGQKVACCLDAACARRGDPSKVVAGLFEERANARREEQ
jgi:ProP effector